jgi:hypothetical protein
MPLACRPRSKSDAAPSQRQDASPTRASADEVCSTAARFPNFARDWDAYLADPLDDVDEDASSPVPAPVGRPSTPHNPGPLTRVRRFLSVRVCQPTRKLEVEPEDTAPRSRPAAALDIDFACPGEDYHMGACCAPWSLYIPRAPSCLVGPAISRPHDTMISRSRPHDLMTFDFLSSLPLPQRLIHELLPYAPP